MATRKAHPKLTPRRIAQLKALANKIDREEGEELRREGKAILLRNETVRQVISLIKTSRLDKGMSLTEVADRSGIGKANLSGLENDPAPNPTLETLMRYVEAVGDDPRISVSERS